MPEDKTYRIAYDTEAKKYTVVGEQTGNVYGKYYDIEEAQIEIFNLELEDKT